MVQRLAVVLGVVVVGGVLVGALGGGGLLGALADTEADDEFEFVDCFGFPVTVEDTETDAVHVLTENLTTQHASVRATNETPPGPNGTFRIETERLEAEDVCMYERVAENGSQMELINITNENSTIIGPGLRTSYERGTADRLVIETQLTVPELVEELL